MAWSSKKVEQLLKALSHGGKAFPVTESARKVGGYTTRGYLSIDMAYGGCKLVYNMPYSTAIKDVTSGFVSSGKLADRLETMGTEGLAATFRSLEKHHKPLMRERFLRLRGRK